jgi:hypothetical protein
MVWVLRNSYIFETDRDTNMKELENSIEIYKDVGYVLH